ncbi:MAG: relaxase/mobilization nuclease domain-containing protein, partial [Oscillospiraceae bacterium]|nr:relaxase/mobilization nuclease domain-containing protein [Oscillospiraceae bacterium]
MPIVKSIAIHESPRRLVEYILDAKKNKDLKYATGICCHKEPEYAYRDLRDFYTLWSNKQFCNTAISGKKEDVLLIHYIQSFRPDECTPELAHKIGIQWVKRVFGSKRPVVISTHDNKSHIHNHFAVSVFDTEGKRWYLNKTTLRKCREESDKLAREYGLSVLDDAQYHPTQKYAEWLARKTGTSWKARIADQIDRLIYEDNVRSVDDLVEVLREKGYTVNYKKYISVKPPNGKKSVRTFRLGDGYSIECLEYRIQHKNIEITDVDAEQYQGLARDYAVYLREMQLMIYRREQTYHKATYY